MSQIALYSQLVIVGILAVAFHLRPRLARGEIYFAVTVHGSFRDGAEARRILFWYRLQIWLHSLVAAALAILGFTRANQELAALGTLWLLLGFITAFLLARRAVQPHAVRLESRREADLAPRQARLPGGWIGQLAPFVILALVSWLLFARWDLLPAQWPVRWGIDGTAAALRDRTVFIVYRPLATVGTVCGLCVLMAYGISRYSRRISPAGPGADNERTFKSIVLWLLLASEYFLVLRAGVLSLMPLFSNAARTEMPAWLLVALSPAILLLVLVPILLRVGQGGSRLGAQPVRDRPVGDRTRDECWILGLIYFNRDDPAIFVEKRIGIGYTMNFGNVWVWLVLAGILAIPVLLGILRPSGS